MAEARKHPILVVDDEPDILFSLQALLRHDFEVHTAESGSQALEILRQQPIHVIMTDQRMPSMTGVELLRQARGESPEAIRIIFTGYADLKAVIEAVNQGEIYRYLTKPWDPEDLRVVLRQACEQYEAIHDREQLLGDVQAFLTRTAPIFHEAHSSGIGEEIQKLLRRLNQRLGK